MSERSDKPPAGPWSDLPTAPPSRVRPLAWRPTAWRPTTWRPTAWRSSGRRRSWREPLVNNWRGLLIVLFLLFLAPPLAVWAAHLIMGAVAR